MTDYKELSKEEQEKYMLQVEGYRAQIFDIANKFGASKESYDIAMSLHQSVVHLLFAEEFFKKNYKKIELKVVKGLVPQHLIDQDNQELVQSMTQDVIATPDTKDSEMPREKKIFSDLSVGDIFDYSHSKNETYRCLKVSNDCVSGDNAIRVLNKALYPFIFESDDPVVFVRSVHDQLVNIINQK